MVGIDVSIANAFRRILLAEVSLFKLLTLWQLPAFFNNFVVIVLSPYNQWRSQDFSEGEAIVTT